MPRLTIDGIAVEVAEGVTVLEAAQSVDIPIPHFCWHPALGKAGACRVCAVKLLDGPVKGIQMSCMLPAQEGMVVSTVDPEAVAMRQQVIEWLMINHPHDCPVCDEGGQCQLQDYTIACGHGLRRYDGKKRTHLNQDLGPNIEHEMNRCIQCYRCVRFYQEFAGGTDFGVMGSASRVYFGRFEDGALQSPFSGNLVDICPTGVFTDRTARFRARYWDFDMAPSICPECSLGCSTTPVARYRELLKISTRHNSSVNGWFICDRGRFADKKVNSFDRPRVPRVNGSSAGWEDALKAVIRKSAEFAPGSIAIAASSRLAMEGANILPELARKLSNAQLCFFMEDKKYKAAMVAVLQVIGHKSASMADVTAADCIVIYDCDLRQEAPMMLLAVRQAWRNGAPVFLVGRGASLEQAAAVSVEAVDLEFIEEIPIGIFDRPVIIFSTVRSSAPEIENLMGADAKFAPLFDGPNGMGLAGIAGLYSAISLESAVRSGAIKGIITVESTIPDEIRGEIPIIAALDWQMNSSVQTAGIFLPTTAWVEMDGTFVNNEGRVQQFNKVMEPGTPVIAGLESGHPSRDHSLKVPGGEPKPAAAIITSLISALDHREGKS